MSQHSVIHLGTSAILKVLGLAYDDGTYQNDATVTLEDFTERQTGDQVTGTGITYPLSIPYVIDSNGDYQVELPADIAVTVGHAYIATIKAVSALGLEKVWYETVRAKRAIA